MQRIIQLCDIDMSFLCSPKFGRVYNLIKSEFVESIDKERASVTVVVHLYENVSIGGSQNEAYLRVMSSCAYCNAIFIDSGSGGL